MKCRTCGPAVVASKSKETPIEDNSTKTDDKDAASEGIKAGKSQMEEENVAGTPREYAMDRKERHVGNGDNVRYVARRYGSCQETIQWSRLPTFPSTS